VLTKTSFFTQLRDIPPEGLHYHPRGLTNQFNNMHQLGVASEPWHPNTKFWSTTMRCSAVLNMIRFPDRTGFGNSEPHPYGTGFRKSPTGSNVDIHTVLITKVKCLISGFSII